MADAGRITIDGYWADNYHDGCWADHFHDGCWADHYHYECWVEHCHDGCHFWIVLDSMCYQALLAIVFVHVI